jgi:hypothetical protein
LSEEWVVGGTDPTSAGKKLPQDFTPSPTMGRPIGRALTANKKVPNEPNLNFGFEQPHLIEIELDAHLLEGEQKAKRPLEYSQALRHLYSKRSLRG